jgi:beta-xylosidase
VTFASRRFQILWFLVQFLAVPPMIAAQQGAAYLNPTLSVDWRVADLLSRMTLEEKVAQLVGTWQNPEQMKPNMMFVGPNREFLPDRAAVTLKNGLSQMTRPSEHRGPREMAEFTNTVQKWIMEHTRLGIPILFHEECLHGLVAPGATSYPQAIALASTWDPALVHEVFTATAQEARARGAQQCLMPVLDLARDPRWGRTEETYGEDPFLVSRIGVAVIRGLQGDFLPIDNAHVMATAKHFAVHGQPEGGTNTAPGNYSERVIRQYFLAPFEAAVKEGKVENVMASYNEIDGIPSHGNRRLLEGILRQEWGFRGIVDSDYFGITDLMNLHHVVGDKDDAGRLALESGVDIEFPFADAYANLATQVRDGRISEATIDRSVSRVLRSKFITGLFDHPYVDPVVAEKVSNSPEHQQLAVEAAREAIILLKNDKNLLPLDRTKYKRIAVIGPNAADVHLGGYSDKPGRGVSILQGIKDKLGNSRVVYSEGCRITETPPDWDADKVVLGDPALNAKRIQAAVETAKTADAVILVLGENEQTSREAWAVGHPGDRDSLNLLGNQDDLVKAILPLGKPVVVFLLQGRPDSINYIAENVPAILEGWYLGQEGGTAAADVLFGDYNPGGKLPITMPRSVGQLPDYYYQKPSAKREYLGTTTEPLFPFGWGLSYTTFAYSNLHLDQNTIGTEGSVKVLVDIANTGNVAGDEVVQLYVHERVTSVTQAVKELRGFQRVSLKPGESKAVELSLGPEQLSFLNRDMKRVVEPGIFDVMVGGNSRDLNKTVLTVGAR